MLILDELEEWVMREGEKLSDLLSMPVKDSLGISLFPDNVYFFDLFNKYTKILYGDNDMSLF